MPRRRAVRFCDELPHGLGWIVDDELMRRCSHALVADGRVWLVDPVDGDGVEERVREAGEPAGVLQLLRRHNRDSRALADRLGVPLSIVPAGRVGPFELRVVRAGRPWREIALWWPERSTLVVADVLGTAPYFVAPGERLGVHPVQRPFPPRRSLGDLAPQVVLCGHGEGVLAGAEVPFQEALSTARRRIPRLAAGLARPRRR